MLRRSMRRLSFFAGKKTTVGCTKFSFANSNLTRKHIVRGC